MERLSQNEKKAWPMVRLGDICDFRRGLTYAKSDEVDFSHNVVLRSNNITLETGQLDLSDLKYLRSDFQIPKDKQVVPHTLLMCMANGSKAHLGKVALVEDDIHCAFGGFMGLLVPKGIVPKYLYFALVSPLFKDRIVRLQDGANINNLKFSDFADFPIPLPPLSVQCEIVAHLDKKLNETERLAAHFKRIGQRADAEFKAELDETFDTIEGEKFRLGAVFDFIDYRGKTPTKTSSGIPLITAKNVRQGYLDYQEEFFISEAEFATRQRRGIAHKGDILFTTEAPLGFVALADKEVFSTGQRIISFQWKDKKRDGLNKYFLYCLMSEWFQVLLRAQATGATAQGIKASRLVSLPIIYVPIEQQCAIVARLDVVKARCERLKAAAEKGLLAAKALHSAILSEVFTP